MVGPDAFTKNVDTFGLGFRPAGGISVEVFCPNGPWPVQVNVFVVPPLPVNVQPFALRVAEGLNPPLLLAKKLVAESLSASLFGFTWNETLLGMKNTP